MSNARRHRRRISRTDVTWRPQGVELSHEARERVALLIDAHDDDTVSLDAYKQLCREWGEYVATLPDAERIEACMRVSEHVNTHLAGMPVEVVAFVYPRHGTPTVVARRTA